MIYSKIRRYQGYGGPRDSFLENRWWALLGGISKTKRDNLKQILRNSDFRAEFDIQLDIPGLQGGMRLGATHTMFAMPCHDVSFRLIYLNITNQSSSSYTTSEMRFESFGNTRYAIATLMSCEELTAQR